MTGNQTAFVWSWSVALVAVVTLAVTGHVLLSCAILALAGFLEFR